MSQRQLIIYLCAILVLVFGLVLAWEFLLEGPAIEFLWGHPHEETAAERWLYIVTVTSFTAIILGVCFFLMRRAVLERQKAEQEAAHKSSILEAALEGMVQAIAVYDAENRLLRFNEHFAVLFNFPKGFLRPGLPYPDIVRYRALRGDFGIIDMEEVRDKVLQLSEDRMAVQSPQWDQSVVPDGRAYVRHIRPMSGGGWVVTYTDFSEQRKLDQKIQGARSSRALGQVTSGVAHEFNNMLQVVTGHLELLERDLPLQEGARERLQQVLHGVFRGKELTHRLLSYSGKQAMDPQQIDVGSFVEECIPGLRRELGGKMVIKNVCAADLWPIHVDAGRLREAIFDLVSNARDAMPGGGTLTIEAKNVRLDEAQAATRPFEVVPGDYVVIGVSDTGVGMSEAVKAHVFDPFFTTKEVGQGIGLGLSMVFGFVRRQCGGFIEIEAEPGEGTSVRLYLPRAAEQSPAEAVDSGNGRPVILVAEDNVTVLGVTAETLEMLGYRVLRAESAARALDIAESTEGIDLLLADVVLDPQMNGIELARILRERIPDIKVLYMSGHPKDIVDREGMLDGPLLSKPFGADRLAREIKTALHDGGKV